MNTENTAYNDLIEATNRIGYSYTALYPAIAIPFSHTVTDNLAQGILDVLALPDLDYQLLGTGTTVNYLLICTKGE